MDSDRQRPDFRLRASFWPKDYSNHPTQFVCSRLQRDDAVMPRSETYAYLNPVSPPVSGNQVAPLRQGL
jgi:hypothetical protein